MHSSETDRVLTAEAYKLTDTAKHLPEMAAAVDELLERVGPASHVASVQLSLFPSQASRRSVGILAFRRLLGASYKEPFSEQELPQGEEQEGRERVRIAREAFPVKGDAPSVADACWEGGRLVLPPSAERGREKLGDAARRQEVSVAYGSTGFTKLDVESERLDEVLPSSRRNSCGCSLVLACDAPVCAQTGLLTVGGPPGESNGMTEGLCVSDEESKKAFEALAGGPYQAAKRRCSSRGVHAYASMVERHLVDASPSVQYMGVPVSVPHFVDVLSGSKAPRYVPVGVMCMQ